MNHVVEVSVWHCREYRTTKAVVLRERGGRRIAPVTDRRAAELAMLVNGLACRGKVKIYPLMVQGFYGWAAERVSAGP